MSASFGSANTAATVFGTLTLLNIVDLARTCEGRHFSGPLNLRRFQRLAPHLARPLIALALSASCLVLTFSRGGIAATSAVAVVLIGVMIFTRSRRGAFGAPAIATLLILIGVGAAYLALNADALLQRYQIAGSDGLTRGQIFAAHWQAFLAAPWGGFGLGTFPLVNATSMNPANVALLDLVQASHNVFLQWLEEGGAVGALALCVLALALAFGLGTRIRYRRAQRTWLLGIGAVGLLVFVHGMTDFALQVPSVATTLLVLMGMACARRPAETAAAPGSRERGVRNREAASAA